MYKENPKSNGGGQNRWKNYVQIAPNGLGSKARDGLILACPLCKDCNCGYEMMCAKIVLTFAGRSPGGVVIFYLSQFLFLQRGG